MHLPTDGIPLVDFLRGSILGRHKYSGRNNTVNQLTLKGTTTIGVVCKDGVILASDTRVTMGYFIAHKQGKGL